MSRSIWKPLYQHLNVDKAAFPNGSRGEDTVKAKQKHKVSYFISNFVKKMNLGRIWFIIIHSFINSKSNEFPQSLGRI